MNNYLQLTLCAITLGIAMNSCSKEDPININNPNKNEQVTPIAPTITISTDITISSDGGNESISFNASDKWTATSNVDWITLSATNGNSGDATITATIKGNDTYDQRNGSITLKTGSVSKDITVTQMQLDAIIIAQKEYKIGFEAQALDFGIQNNVEFSVELSVSWIKQISSRGLVSSKLFFDVEENTSGKNREGLITLISGNIKETVAVIQESKNNENSLNGHEYVDLGITDECGNTVYWAKCNLGAEDNEYGTGKYYAWAETKGRGEIDTTNVHNYLNTNSYEKKKFDWSTYKYTTVAEMDITKYSCEDGRRNSTWYSADDIYVGLNGVKNQKKLEPMDDAATVNWGQGWRTPTLAEFTSLKDSCYWKWVERINDEAIGGFLIFKPKASADKGRVGPTSTASYTLDDPHIFLRAAGLYYGGTMNHFNSWVSYWTSELYNTEEATNYHCTSSGINTFYHNTRFYGQTIRPVYTISKKN